MSHQGKMKVQIGPDTDIRVVQTLALRYLLKDLGVALYLRYIMLNEDCFSKATIYTTSTYEKLVIFDSLYII